MSASLFLCVTACFQLRWNIFDHTSLPSQQLLTPHFQPSLVLLLWTEVWSALWWAVWGWKCFNIRVGRLTGGWLKYTNPAMTNMKCPHQVYIEIPNTLAQSSTTSSYHWYSEVYSNHIWSLDWFSWNRGNRIIYDHGQKVVDFYSGNECLKDLKSGLVYPICPAVLKMPSSPEEIPKQTRH